MHKIAKDVAKIISVVMPPGGSKELVNVISVYFEEELGFPKEDFRTMALKNKKNLDLNKPKKSKDSYTDAIERSILRLKKETGFGIAPEIWDEHCQLTGD